MSESVAARKSVKAKLTAEESRRKREEDQIAIRKQKREENLSKRRNLVSHPIQDQSQTQAQAQSSSTLPQNSEIPQPTETDMNQEELPIEEQLNHLPELIQILNNGTPDAQTQATAVFRKLLSIEDNPPIDQVIACGAVQKFVQFLECPHPRLQFEAAWSLTNVASGNSEQTKVVIQAGAVPPFIRLLSPTNTNVSDEIREQSVWALGNIAGDSGVCRDYLLQCGIMQPLIDLISIATKPSLIRNATWTMSNLCRGKPAPPFESVKGFLPTLAHLLYHADVDVLTDAAWGMNYISDGSQERIAAVIDCGILRRIVELLGHPHTAIQTPALRVIGNIATGDSNQTQAIINVGCLPALYSLLSSHKKTIRKEACWTISNITAGTKKQIQAVLDAGMIGTLLHLMEHGEFEVKKEAAWSISNACSGGTTEQIRYLAQQGCVGPLCELLNSSDSRIVSVALEGLEKILNVGEKDSLDGCNIYAQEIEEADGLSKIEILQAHQNTDIYDKATKILEKYFHAEEVDGSMAPQMEVSGAQTTFSFGLPSQSDQSAPGQQQQQQQFF